MADLIDRQAAIDALGEAKQVSDPWTDEFAIGEYKQWKHDHDAIIDLPSAQPEREHSEWELKTFDDGYGEYQLYVCKRCGGVTAHRRKFCPDCGADLRGDNE